MDMPDNRFQENNTFLNIIGDCNLGGKAQGLASMNDILHSDYNQSDFPQIDVHIPKMTVICTDVFDAFMEQNNLHAVAFSDLSDDRIAYAFQKADLPFEVLGELRRLIENTHTPLAIRSSSLLEDSTLEPFAGVYATKMTPNNQFDPQIRFGKLLEAIKYVYASTFFKSAKGYMSGTKHRLEDEKMAVIIQEVVGKRHEDRFYPELSGVVRSYNFYPVGRAKNEDGVVNLALGLGKTVVDGEISWAYSPTYPQISPPYNSIGDLLEYSQNRFWAINMGKPPEYDPIKETEYLLHENLMTAESDGVLKYLVSTFDMHSGRLISGVGRPGPRVLNFSPLLVLEMVPVNKMIRRLLELSESRLNAPVEIEFAMTFEPHRFAFLQVRPMLVSATHVKIQSEELNLPDVLAASEKVLGNDVRNDLHDIVYVKPETFAAKHTRNIANELESINQKLIAKGNPYLLIVLGRLGSYDPWLGIPVNWGQISGAKMIIEATQQNINVEMSQGSHFFHNLTNLRIGYFSMPHSGKYKIDWEWLNNHDAKFETEFIRHIRLSAPLLVKLDGQQGRGVIFKP